MRKLFLFLLIGICSAQVTPHIGLNVPVHGTPNYDVQLNANFEALDSFLSGGSALPGMVGCTVNNTLYVGGLCAATWGGGDIGSQINAAYATLPKGGMIQVLPSNAAYAFTTPIVLLGAANPVTLNCNPGANGYQTITGGTILNYTPTSGIALTVAGSIGSQVNGCTLVGPGPTTSAIGMLVGGPTTGDSSILSFYNSNNISNFGVGLQFGNYSFIDSFTNNWIHDNGPNGGDKNIYVPAGLSNFGENISFIGGLVSNNPPSSGYSAICVDILTGGSLKFYGVSFDQCGITFDNTNGVYDFQSDHFENPNYATAKDFITLGPVCFNCLLNIYGGDFFEGGASARTEFILEASTVSNNSNTINIFGTAFTPGESAVVVNTSGGAATCCQRFSITGYQPGVNLAGPFAGVWDGTYFQYVGQVTSVTMAAQQLNQSAANAFAGVSACVSSTKVISFPITYTSQPVILVFDETTKGGANLSAKSTSGFTVSCTGATDTFDWTVVGNPN